MLKIGAFISLVLAAAFFGYILTRGTSNTLSGAIPHSAAVRCPADASVIVTLGQSQATNSGPERYTPKHPVFSLYFVDGQCYSGADPLPGTHGQGGNFAGRLADLLIERGRTKAVILAAIAVDGSNVHDWTGPLSKRIDVLLDRLAKAGLRPDMVLWWQGEANANDPSPEPYAKALQAVIQRFRDAGVSAPFLVAKSSLCGPFWPNSVHARQAQAGIVNPPASIFAGPDTDTLGPAYRHDGCHFSAAGQARAAELWADAIAAIPR